MLNNIEPNCCLVMALNILTKVRGHLSWGKLGWVCRRFHSGATCHEVCVKFFFFNSWIGVSSFTTPSKFSAVHFILLNWPAICLNYKFMYPSSVARQSDHPQWLVVQSYACWNQGCTESWCFRHAKRHNSPVGRHHAGVLHTCICVPKSNFAGTIGSKRLGDTLDALPKT